MDIFRYNTVNYLSLEELARLRHTSQDFFLAYLDRLRELENTPEPFLVAIELDDMEMFSEIFKPYMRLNPNLVYLTGNPIRLDEIYKIAYNMQRTNIARFITEHPDISKEELLYIRRNKDGADEEPYSP